jgi:superfamily II DNA/RNA helicase
MSDHPKPGDDLSLTAMPADSPAVPEPGAADSPVGFAALGVPAALTGVLDDQGITAPFPVQAATLPDALAGRDILGRARTGSGKTLGFSLPLVVRLAGRPTAARRPRGLVLVPTRELATQVTEVLKPLARAMDLWVTTIYGGVSYGPQVTALRRGTDVVVATPGRLADLIGQRECDLSDVEVTVVDEADQMADLGFLPVVRQLLEATPEGGQRMLFSATLDAAVDVLARRFLSDPVLHSVDENSSPAEIEHHVLTVDGASRVAVLTALAGGLQRSLVFTRTKHGAERLARQLTQAGIPAAELHGNLRQGARARNLDAFASGLARVMVATDIAARGIHVDGIELVVHADPPTEHKAYVHRSGRTARAGTDGVVVTLQSKAQVRDVAAMMSKAGITPHEAVVADADSAVLTELAGPPAPRVTVTGKVAELVQPEDRLARNDRPGIGKPWEGGPRRGREGKPREGRPVRTERQAPPVRDRDRGRPAGGQADRAERTERPGGVDRGRPPERTGRSERGDRSGAARSDRDPRDRGPRNEGGNRNERDSRDSRAGRDSRDSRDERGGNDWWPHSGARRTPGGRPTGSSWSPAGENRPARDGRRARGGNPARESGQARDGREFGDSRPAREEWPFRGGDYASRAQAGGRPQAGRQPSRSQPNGAGRPQGGGQFGGSSRRPGNGTGRGTAGRRAGSEQG